MALDHRSYSVDSEWIEHRIFEIDVLSFELNDFIQDAVWKYEGCNAFIVYNLRPGEHHVVGYDSITSLSKYERF